MKTLNDYSKEVHEANSKWWVCLKCNDEGAYRAQLTGAEDHYALVVCPFCTGKKSNRNVGELLMLSVSELAEGMEGIRKGLKDDKLPQYDMLDVELIDCVIRVFDLLGSRGVDVEEIYQAKMNFNSVRPDHKIENRLKDGGKKF